VIGGLGGAACAVAQLAAHVEAETFLLGTGSDAPVPEGAVDVVVDFASCTEPSLLPRLAPGARWVSFAESGRRSSLDLSPAPTNFSYFEVDLVDLCRQRSALIRPLLFELRVFLEHAMLEPVPHRSLFMPPRDVLLRELRQLEDDDKITVHFAR
jgi:hypothetical protein